MLGDWFNTIALSALITRLSGGSSQAGLAISGLLLARFLPPLIVTPYIGVLVDRLNRRRLLLISDFARAGIVLCFLIAAGLGSLPLIYGLIVLQFVFTALFEPARSALLPSVVRAEDLVTANILGSVTWSVMLAAGAAIGGAVAAVFGTEIALIIDSLSFVLSGLLILSIRLPVQTTAPASESGQNVHTDQRGFWDGIRYVREHPQTAATLLIKFGGSLGSIDAFMVLYATQLFIWGQDGAGSLGLFYASFGVGAVLGPILIQRLNDGTPRTMRRLVIVGYAAISLGWFLFGGAAALGFAAAAIIVKSMGSAIYWTYSSAILQQTVPDRFLGRMFSLDYMGFQFMTVVSTILTGLATNGLSGDAIRGVVFWTGALSLIPLVVWALIVPRLERLTQSA
jgi:MFS family permease